MTTPIPAEDLPKALAEVMGWHKSTRKTRACEIWEDGNDNFMNFVAEFCPNLVHDDAQICVEECAKRGLTSLDVHPKGEDGYLEHLAAICDASPEYEWASQDIVKILFATPEQKSRAALAALTGK